MTTIYQKIINVISRGITTGDVVPLNSFALNGKPEAALYLDIASKIEIKYTQLPLQVLNDKVYFELPLHCFELNSVNIPDIGEISLSELITDASDESYREFKNININDFLNLVDMEGELVDITYRTIDPEGLATLADYFIDPQENNDG